MFSIFARILKRMVFRQEITMHEIIERWGFETAEAVENASIYTENQLKSQWKRRIR